MPDRVYEVVDPSTGLTYEQEPEEREYWRQIHKKRRWARQLKQDGHGHASICSILGISDRTLLRYLRTA